MNQKDVFLKYFIFLLAILLSGCATIHNPYPKDYAGPSAIIESSDNRIDQSTVELFYLEKINNKLIANTMGASRRATQGQGFSFTTKLIETAIPILNQTFTIVGVTAHAAPIQTLFSDSYLVRGEITFIPEPDTRYLVKGTLSESYSAVWIENKATGEIITKKIENSATK